MFIHFVLATVQNFSVETVRIWHSFHVHCSSDGVCVLCKIVVFVLKIADAIKPTRKMKSWKKSIPGILI
jgi:formylmethanofuran dehydrogenase subunit A